MPKIQDIKKVLVIGSGPIIIGQAAEFDYAGTQACRSLKEEGIEVVLLNSNPATIMTDKDIADKVYIEPLTVEVVEQLILKEKPDSVLPTLGGQAGLNLAMELEEREQDAMRHLFKEPTIPREVAKYEPPVNLDSLLDGLTLAKLQKIFDSVMKRKEDKIDPVRSSFGTIKKEPVSLEQKIGSVMMYARAHRTFSFRQILEKQTGRLEVVVTFLAVLELMKMGKIALTQEALFDDMYIETLEPEGEEGELKLDGLEDFEEQE